MAKKYEVKNITTSPARPIQLMCCACGGALGMKENVKTLSTDGTAVVLTAEDYGHCKEALDRYEAADMVVVKEIEGEMTDDEKAEIKKREEENAKAKADSELEGLREEAKSLKIKGYHLMKADKLKEAIEKANSETEED